MKKDQKGFTLIELLAVIVILALVALIATPLILNIIQNAQKGALKSTAYGIIEAGKFGYTSEILKTGEMDTTAFTYIDAVEIANPSGKKLDYKGEKPKTGIVIVNSEGKIALAIHNGDYCAEKDYDDLEVTINEKTQAQCIIIFNADLSGASAPELSANMIPIKWDGTRWIKADVNNMYGANQWYDYNQQQWANVALVSSTTRAGYLTAAVGSPVNETDIMAYLVWIPRYKYKLFNAGAIAAPIQTINIEFEDSTEPKSVGAVNDEYLTHPAFTFDSEQLNGFWVGKFETTGDATTPTIKPNVRSLTNQIVDNQFTTAQRFNITTTYGLTSTNDSHMMKNIEWGAIAYLSQSRYGKDGNSTYTGAIGLEKEIYINNINTDLASGSGPTITGCAGDAVASAAVRSATCPATNQYQTVRGVKASTTGNIYGVYDMSGGSWETTLGVIYDVAALVVDEDILAKYIDSYDNGLTYNDQSAYNRRLLGDATGEIRSWNGDYSYFICLVSPLFRRGGYYNNGANAGIFGFYNLTTSSGSSYSFRVVTLGE